MKRIKNMTKKQKTIAAVTVAGIVLTGGVIGLVSTMDNGFDNEAATEQVSPERSELKLTLDYGETPKEEYKVNMDGEELIINTADVTPEIDTSKIGTTNHEVEIDDMLFDLTVVVEDNRELTLNEFTELTVETGTSKEDLESKVVEGLTPETEEGEELDFSFSYPSEFDLDTEGEHEVEVTANFKNNRRNSVKQTIKVNLENPKEEVEEEPEVDEVAKETESSSESTGSSNSGSTGSSNSGSTGGSSKSGSTASSKSGSTGSSSGSSSSGNTGSSTGSSKSSSSKSSSTGSSGNSNSGSSFGEGTSFVDEEAEVVPETKPEPKPEPKPETKPKPEVKPEPAPKRSSSLPAGITVTSESSTGVEFSVNNRSLPGGGTIQSGILDLGKKAVVLMGNDNAGKFYGAGFSRAGLEYIGDYPTLSDADNALLRELGGQLLSAYGM